MTRVILTNKQTGQELPEAELVYESSTTWGIQFDGAARYNVAFSRSEWDYREVRTFRNGDVLRRKDRDDIYVQYIYVVNVHDSNGRWLSISADGSTRDVTNPTALTNHKWELV